MRAVWLEGAEEPIDKWRNSDRGTNGSPFDNAWLASHVLQESVGHYLLALNDYGDTTKCPKERTDVKCEDATNECCDQKYASGEMRSDGEPDDPHPYGWYGHGCFTVEMKSAAAEGMLSTFFLANYINYDFVGEPEDTDYPEDYFTDGTRTEIDIEVFGIRTPDGTGAMTPAFAQYSVYADSGDPAKLLDFTIGAARWTDEDDNLRFDFGDPSAKYHRYDILWLRDFVEIWVDGDRRRAFRTLLPRRYMRVYANVWSVRPQTNEDGTDLDMSDPDYATVWNGHVPTDLTPRSFTTQEQEDARSNSPLGGKLKARYRRFRYYHTR